MPECQPCPRLWVTCPGLTPGAQSLTREQDRPAFLQQEGPVATVRGPPWRVAQVRLQGKGIQVRLPTGGDL